MKNLYQNFTNLLLNNRFVYEVGGNAEAQSNTPEKSDEFLLSLDESVSKKDFDNLIDKETEGAKKEGEKIYKMKTKVIKGENPNEWDMDSETIEGELPRSKKEIAAEYANKLFNTEYQEPQIPTGEVENSLASLENQPKKPVETTEEVQETAKETLNTNEQLVQKTIKALNKYSFKIDNAAGRGAGKKIVSHLEGTVKDMIQRGVTEKGIIAFTNKAMAMIQQIGSLNVKQITETQQAAQKLNREITAARYEKKYDSA